MQIDFRDVYASILKDWFEVNETQVQSLFDHTVTFYPLLRACNLGIEDLSKLKEGEEKMNLDKMKAMMNQANVEEKLDQNEELAELRADTSIQKTILGKTLPSSDKAPDQVSIIRGGN